MPYCRTFRVVNGYVINHFAECAKHRYNVDNMRRHPLRRLLPGAIELGYIAVVVCVLILAGNAKLILERAGLIGSASLIGQQVSTKASWGLNVLDTFRFTANVINLIVWGVMGLVIYSTLQAIVQGLRTIEYTRDVDSKLYVHPQNFTHHAYWRQIVAEAALGFVLLALLATGAILYIIVVVPASFAYLQRFILKPGLTTALDPLKSLVVAFVGTVVLYLVLKLVIRHHRVTAVGA